MINSCICKIELTNGHFDNGIISDKKFKKFVRENGFIHKLTRKIYSKVSNTIIRYFLKFRLPIMPRQFFNLISQNPDRVKTFCIDMDKPLKLAIRKRMIKQ